MSEVVGLYRTKKLEKAQPPEQEKIRVGGGMRRAEDPQVLSGGLQDRPVLSLPSPEVNACIMLCTALLLPGL